MKVTIKLDEQKRTKTNFTFLAAPGSSRAELHGPRTELGRHGGRQMTRSPRRQSRSWWCKQSPRRSTMSEWTSAPRRRPRSCRTCGPRHQTCEARGSSTDSCGVVHLNHPQEWILATFLKLWSDTDSIIESNETRQLWRKTEKWKHRPLLHVKQTNKSFWL